MEDNVSNFVAITDATPEVAQGYLQLANGDVGNAIALFYENPDLASGFGASHTTTATTTSRPAQPATGTATGNLRIGREDSSGVIHIDSDDDDEDDMEMLDDMDHVTGQGDDREAVMQAAAMAQEDEDAAMAKRLQEELYSENNGSGSGAGGGAIGEDVRAPIARTTETLVAPDPLWGGQDDLETAFLEQMRRRRAPPARAGGPFAQTIWSDSPRSSSQQATPSSENGAHARRLEDLFRPPYDLMERATWDDARSMGKEDRKWIMVNLQDMSDFNCQALNRDIWKDQAVRDLVSEHFIFLQYDKDYPDAEEYITFYCANQSHENPDNYPHVTIIDPRTGEKVKSWIGRPFPTAPVFHSELAEFLDRYSLAANSKNPVAKTATRRPQEVDVDRMTEEEMLEMAMKNSLAAGATMGESSRSTSNPNIHDPDALTKSPAPADAPVTTETSAFAEISSTSPHEEPDNDPASTTRIQFRHPSGRVIRRFKLQDPVARLYEWLKAAPLEGQEGVEFELKRMPQGQDLIAVLDDTVEGAGLKQGTVMIEFIEE